MSVEDDVDELYGVAPEDFLARRKELAAAAKKRGDADAAKLIAAARRPTRAAWVVNVLVRADDSARNRLHDLSDRLRAAHAAMDGAKIRELTSTQRRLIDDLVRVGLHRGGHRGPVGCATRRRRRHSAGRDRRSRRRGPAGSAGEGRTVVRLRRVRRDDGGGAQAEGGPQVTGGHARGVGPVRRSRGRARRGPGAPVRRGIGCRRCAVRPLQCGRAGVRAKGRVGEGPSTLREAAGVGRRCRARAGGG